MFSATASQVTNGTQYVDDVFSAYTYTGNGSTQTITNGIDLAGKGGMVWLKNRSIPSQHVLYDTTRGVTKEIQSSTANAENTESQGLTAFGSTGFSLGTRDVVNGNTNAIVSWTFRKAPKFFDVQTTTLSSGNATVSFTDLTTLGMVIVKRTDSTGSWYVWHRSLTAGKLLYLEQTSAEATLGHITVSGTTLTLVDGILADGNYVCYGFAHDTSTDGIIQCGSFTTDGSYQATVTLGWEAQFVLTKPISTVGDWRVTDMSRGFAHDAGNNPALAPNLSSAESLSGTTQPRSTGFREYNLNTGVTHIYLAIRRPNKPPTSGTQVYNAIGWTGNSTARQITGVGFSPDVVIAANRNGYAFASMDDRLRGVGNRLQTSATVAEVNYTNTITAFGMDGFSLGVDSNIGVYNVAPDTIVGWNFRRAVGVMDLVCYIRPAAEVTLNHSLAAIPELIIVKDRTSATAWLVYVGSRDTFLQLDKTNAITTSSGFWGTSGPTSTTFQMIPQFGNLNDACVAYLFATKAGISKVGSYTGNGSSQTINCGFSTGARFILIKRTDSTGDWFVWDTVRGIIAGNDPHLSLNTTAAEVTTDDSIDPDTSGFIVNQVAATNINVTSASYIFLAFA